MGTIDIPPESIRVLPIEYGSIRKPDCPHKGCNYRLDTAIIDDKASNLTSVTFGFWCVPCQTFFRYTADVFDTSGHYWLLCRAIEDTHLVVFTGSMENLKKEYMDQTIHQKEEKTDDH